MAQFNSGYSSSEILAMQRDAAERVREMQRRAQERLLQSNGQQMSNPNHMNMRQPSPSPHNSRPGGGAPAVPVSPPRQEVSPPHHAVSKPSSPSFFGGSLREILDRFHLDQDRIVLILLFLVLVREEADPMLLLALAYIFL